LIKDIEADIKETRAGMKAFVDNNAKLAADYANLEKRWSEIDSANKKETAASEDFAKYYASHQA
jgi:regulator of replication initiation timing